MSQHRSAKLPCIIRAALFYKFGVRWSSDFCKIKLFLPLAVDLLTIYIFLPFIKMNSEVLALPSLRSELREEVLERVDQILEDLRTEMRPLMVVNQIGLDYVLKNALHNKRKELAAAERLISILNEEFHAGYLDYENGALHMEGDNLECRIKSLLEDTLVLRTSHYEMSGRIRDDVVWRQGYGSISINTPIDETYIDALIARYKTPERARLALFAPKDVSAEKRFRKNVFKAYDAKRSKLAWCVISGQWHDAKHVTVFDIIPHSMGEPTAQHFLGPQDSQGGHLMGAKNGMPMHRVYAEALRAGNLVLLPDDGQHDHNGSFSRWRVLFWTTTQAPKIMCFHGGLPSTSVCCSSRTIFDLQRGTCTGFTA